MAWLALVIIVCLTINTIVVTSTSSLSHAASSREGGALTCPDIVCSQRSGQCTNGAVNDEVPLMSQYRQFIV
jgi:hypothetical protein